MPKKIYLKGGIVHPKISEKPDYVDITLLREGILNFYYKADSTSFLDKFIL